MTDRDRLIELMMKAQKKNNETYMEYVRRGYKGDSGNALFVDIADYLLANGVIVPPCKVGDTVYRFAHNKDRSEYKIVDFWEVVKIEIYEDEILIIDDSDNYITVESIGETVFFTKEEAEEKLKEREQ